MRHLIPVLAVCLLAASARAQSSCPLNYIDCNLQQYTSYAPTYSLYCPQEFQQFGSSTVNYDLTTGAFSSSSSGRAYGTGGGFTVYDVYQLVGSTPHCAFTFWANVHLTGTYTRVRTLGAGATFDARLLDTFTIEQSHFYLDTRVSTTIDTVLTIPVSHCTGPFTLSFEMGTSATWGDAVAGAQIIFTGLPPGVSVTSCQGFHEEGPIATLPVTWGNLRARYR